MKYFIFLLLGGAQFIHYPTAVFDVAYPMGIIASYQRQNLPPEGQKTRSQQIDFPLYSLKALLYVLAVSIGKCLSQ